MAKSTAVKVNIEELKAKLAEKGFTKEYFAGKSFGEKVEELFTAGFIKEEISIATGKNGNTVKLSIESIGKVKEAKARASKEWTKVPDEVFGTAVAFKEKVLAAFEAGYTVNDIAKTLEKDNAAVSRIRYEKNLADNAII